MILNRPLKNWRAAIADLNKKLSVLIPSEDEKNAAMSSLRRFTIIALKLLAGIL